MAVTSINARNIPLFNGQDFQMWKSQMNYLFISFDILDIVDGSRQEPTRAPRGQNDAYVDERKRFIRDNGKAMHLISTNVEREIYATISMCTTAKEMWDRLSLLHEQRSATTTSLLLQRFHEYVMDTSNNVGQHFAKVRNMARTLNDLGQGISETVIMSKILSSLPSKFLTFRSAWNSVAPERQTIAYLEARLIEEEAILIKADEGANALAATLHQNKPKKGGKNSSGKTQGKPNNRKPRRDVAEVTCFVCGKKGHYARTCRERHGRSPNS